MPKPTFKFLLSIILCLGVLAVKGQPVASFTTDDTAGCAPLVVHFTNTSTGATSYTWNLGTGPAVTLTDASTAYTTVGTYTVTLTASDGTTSSTATAIIHVYTTPTVSFHANDTAVCPGTPIMFTSTSTPGAWGSLTYTWNFGDGGSSTANSPVYSYPSAGFYNVTLFATNSKGCVNSHSQAAYIHVFTPAAISFSAPTIFCKPPAVVPFTNTTTGTAALTYAWRYGDGGTAATASPTHTYTASGSYTVSLKVTDGHGCQDSLVQPGYVNIGGLASGFSSSPATACIGFPVTFSNTSTSHISSNWSFGDGGSSATDAPVHYYYSAGTYTVRLIVYNGGTCYDTITHTVTVAPSPTGSFTITPAQPCPPPNTLTLTGTLSAGSTASWVFGDSTTGAGATVSHVFHLSKVYTIDMILTNGSGCKDTVQKTDTTYSLYLNASTTSPLSGCAPLAVNFSSYSYTVVSDSLFPYPASPTFLYLSYPYAITSYAWNFGDGSPASTIAIPVHTYTAAGSYNAMCAITTANGCTATTYITINIGAAPHASFTATPRHVCAGRPISFRSTSTGTVDNYFWNFGDGSLEGASDSVVVYTDTVPGIHTVYLTAYDNFCPSTPFALTDSIDSPNASINYAFTCIPDNGIAFTDASLGDNSHTWIFGDGATSTIANPVHYYPSLVTYPVKLTTYNTASGCRDTANTTIDLNRPIVNFSGTYVNICRDQPDNFTSAIGGSHSIPVLGYKWYDNGAAFDSVDDHFTYSSHVRGLHTIALVIKDIRNCLDTLTRANYINVAKPIDNYSFLPGSGCGPLTVNFTDLSTDVPGAPIKQYLWSFGDGDSTTISLPSIAHTFTASGTYSIKEIAIDTFGCKDTLVTNTLSVNTPIAGFSATSTHVCANTTVLFNNTSTGFTSASWSFGDGATSTVPSPVHVYTTPGVYTVRLIVYTSIGCTDTLTFANYITVNPSPIASFHMNDSFAICPPLNVTFSNTSTGAVSYYWTLGDGTSSVSPAPGDIYVSPGVYTIKLAATNSYGCSDTAIGHATIFGYSGAFTYTPVSGCSPLSVHFNASLVAASNIIWDFNDGTTSLTSLDTISHTYHAAGSYIPKLILTDSTGCTSFSLGTDTIKVDTVIAAFTTAPNPGCPNSAITFSNSSASYFSTITARTWTFLPGITSTSVTPTYTYSVSGSYPVTLSVTDGSGCTGTLTKNVTVSPPPPAITGSLSLCSGTTTTLSDAGGTWSISSSSAIATIGLTTGIVYGSGPGTATVTFTSSSTGCFTTAPITIHPSPGPIIGVSGICSGSTATFSDTSAGGTWTSSNTTIATVGSVSGIVTAGASGTAVIRYSFGGSCIVTKTVTVSISPTSITGASAICAGAVTTETDGVPSGAWASSNTAVATVGAASGPSTAVTGVFPGTTIITYSPGAGCTAAKVITVNASPTAVTGIEHVCQGLSTTLSDSTTGGTWSSAPAAIGTVTGTGVVAGTSPGIDTITYSISGCTATALVTVYATPSVITGAATLCAGLSTTLSNTVTGGIWTSSNTSVATVGSTGIVRGVSPSIIPGTSTITYSLGAGCTATKIVSVAPMSPITGITALCSGLTSTLNDAVTGGTWSSSNTTVASIAPASGFLVSLSPGSTTVTYTLPTGCTTTANVVVNLAPLSITGPANVCIGSPTPFTDGGGGTWSIGATGIASVGLTNGIVGGIAPGTATLTYSLGSGCTANLTITVNAAPSVPTGPNTVCAGQAITIMDTTGGGSWSDAGSTAIATIAPASGIVSGLSQGTATITYTITSTGCAARKTITVNPVPSPIGGPASVCTGTSITVNDLTTGGTWSSSNTAIATINATTGTATGLLPGTININYTAATGCIASAVVTVVAFPATITGVGGVCLGATTSLSDLTGGGIWSSSPASAGIATVNPSSGVVSGISIGTAAITYSLGFTCTAYKIITVNPLPALITGAATVCTSADIILSDATTGGTWSSSNTFTATVDTNTGTVYGVFAGPVNIIYTSPLGCTATMPVTVIAGIPPITGTLQACMGFNLVLADALTGGTWSSDNTSVAPVAGGLVTGLSPGTATISYRTSGCPANAIVTINPLPSPITGGPTVCLRLPTPLSDSALGGAWSSLSTLIATISPASGMVTGTHTGNAIIVYTLPTGCTINTLITIDTVPPGIMGVTHLCVGETITLTDTLPGGVWSSNGTAVAPVAPTGSGTTAVVSGLAAGVVNISYTEGGCPAIAIVAVNPLPGPITGASNLCAWGSTLIVHDSTPAGSWTSSLATVSSTGLVISYAAGTAIVTYTLSTGCRVTDTFTVNPLPGPITGASHLCDGLATIFSDTTAGGVWSSSNTSIASIGTGIGLVNSLSPGNATIIYTLPATGCLDSAHVTVYAHPSPISGPSTICADGATATLSDTVSGGAWSSSDPSVASVVVTPPGSSGIVTSESPGTLTITYSVAASCTATKSITVTPVPATHSVTGGGSYCEGGTGVHIGLNGSNTGINYRLYDGAALEDTAIGTSSPIDFGLQTTAGTYTVIAANAATTCNDSMTDSAVITIIPIVVPSISVSPGPTDTICQGSVQAFTSTITNGGLSPTYQWSVNGFPAGSVTSAYSYTPANDDVVTVTLASDAACATPDTASSSVVMTVETPLVLSVTVSADPATTIANGEAVTLTATVINGSTLLTYQWVVNSTPIPGATTATYNSSNFANGDSVSCFVTSAGYCDLSASGWVIMTVSSEGLQQLTHAGQLTVLPNPSKGQFTIKGSLGSTTDEEATLEITDMLGQIVYKDKLSTPGGKVNAQVSLSKTLANGMYLINVRSGSGNQVFHIVVEQ